MYILFYIGWLFIACLYDFLDLFCIHGNIFKDKTKLTKIRYKENSLILVFILCFSIFYFLTFLSFVFDAENIFIHINLGSQLFLLLMSFTAYAEVRKQRISHEEYSKNCSEEFYNEYIKELEKVKFEKDLNTFKTLKEDFKMLKWLLMYSNLDNASKSDLSQHIYPTSIWLGQIENFINYNIISVENSFKLNKINKLLGDIQRIYQSQSIESFYTEENLLLLKELYLEVSNFKSEIY